jgi:hypothetical protein
LIVSFIGLNIELGKNQEGDIMILLKKRKCPECKEDMEPKLINLHYKKENSELQIEVIGIPANVCLKCFYRIIPGKVANYIDSLVDPIFESEIKYKEKILPPRTLAFNFRL